MPFHFVKPANLTIQQTIQQEDTYLSPHFMLKFGICELSCKFQSKEKRTKAWMTPSFHLKFKKGLPLGASARLLVHRAEHSCHVRLAETPREMIGTN